jgi:hypothetical protein
MCKYAPQLPEEKSLIIFLLQLATFIIDNYREIVKGFFYFFLKSWSSFKIIVTEGSIIRLSRIRADEIWKFSKNYGIGHRAALEA